MGMYVRPLKNSQGGKVDVMSILLQFQKWFLAFFFTGGLIFSIPVFLILFILFGLIRLYAFMCLSLSVSLHDTWSAVF